MKNLLFFAVLLFTQICFSQDVIILRNGDEIEAKVTEILNDNIKYKKATNLTGPTYTISKLKVFMIRYESGDKDVFDIDKADINVGDEPVASKSESDDLVFVSPSQFIYDPEIGDPFCQIRKQVGGKLYGQRGNEIFYRQDIVFYGFDMTYLKLSNKSKTGDGIIIAPKYLPAWNELLTNDMLPIQKIRDWMGNRSIFIGNSVFDNYSTSDMQNFVISSNYCIPFEDLQKIVKSYVLREKEGLGMVINLENFNKEREYALIYVTFFDIATREILFAAEISGEAGGAGMTKHWASGVENAFREMFIDQIYKPRRTQDYMIPNKLRFY